VIGQGRACYGNDIGLRNQILRIGFLKIAILWIFFNNPEFQGDFVLSQKNNFIN
jgi:hypothetical protein